MTDHRELAERAKKYALKPAVDNRTARKLNELADALLAAEQENERLREALEGLRYARGCFCSRLLGKHDLGCKAARAALAPQPVPTEGSEK